MCHTRGSLGIKDEMGLSFQLVGRRGMAPSMTRDAYVLGYFDFVQSLHRSGFFDFDPRRIICIDFVTDSRRREYERTRALRGAKQKKIARAAVHKQLPGSSESVEGSRAPFTHVHV